MRHRKSGRKLGRKSSHRTALWNNMVTSLLTHGRIETTEAKAKELRGYAEATITWGISVHELVAKGDKASPQERAQVVHARRMARQTVKTSEALDPPVHRDRSALRQGQGRRYTRILKTRVRKGDAAPMAYVELVGLNGQPE